MTARRPDLLWMLAAAAAIGFLGLEAEARRRNPLEEAVFNTPHGRQILEVSSSSSSAGIDSVRRSLIGKNVDVPKANSPDDHLVESLPLLNPDDYPGKHWAGLLPVNDKGDGYLFYWLFAPTKFKVAEAKSKGLVKQDESNVPLLVWLNGGPACSSMDGLWIENGPFKLDPGNGQQKDWNNIKIRKYSWHNAPAYTLYIDQPVGTGLAFTTSGNYPNNDERVNEDFYYFMTEFMKLHADTLNVKPALDDIPTLQRPFFFSGESHAGHYIPSMMNYIGKKNSQRQKLKKKNGVVMPLSGAAIGNGWFDPIYQYSAQEVAYGYGLLGKAQKRALDEKEEKCRAALRKGDYTAKVCMDLLHDVTANSLGSKNPNIVSQYDYKVIESRNKDRNFPPGHKDVEAYLGAAQRVSNAPVQDVLKAIHATPSWESGQRYRECTDPPYYALAHQDGLGVVPDIVEVLEHEQKKGGKIRLLFFNGMNDLICNHVGNENALENLPWKHKDEYIRAARYGWKAPTTGKLGGYAKEYENLVFLKVLDSGHMVPMDVPAIALDMMIEFMYHDSNDGSSRAFGTYLQDVPRSIQDTSECPSCPSCPKGGIDLDDSNCPESESSCDKQQCISEFQLSEGGGDDSSASGLTDMPPHYEGLLAGILSFFVLMVVFRCCSGVFRKNGGGRRKGANQIEMAATNGGYKDDNNLNEAFDDEAPTGNHVD